MCLCYFSDGKLIPDNTVKKWPFLDIFLYTEDSNYVWGLNYVHLRKFVFLKKDVFPLKYVPFESFMVSNDVPSKIFE